MKETQIKACDAAECIIALDEWLSFVLGALFSTSAMRPQPITMGRRGSYPSPLQERRQQRESWPSRRAAERRGKLSLCRRKDAPLLWTTLPLAPRRLENYFFTSSSVFYFVFHNKCPVHSCACDKQQVHSQQSAQCINYKQNHV